MGKQPGSGLGMYPGATGGGSRDRLAIKATEPTETTNACHRHEHGVARHSAGHRSRAGPARRQPLGWRPDSHPSALDGERVRGSRLLRDLGARGARFARELGVDVVVGAETAGVPLAASVSLAAGLPFAFVRKPGYRGHEIDEPPVRGADVAGRRVLLVDDAVSSGTAVERFTAALVGEGAEVVGVFVLVDMREVADSVTSVAAALPTESVSTYLQVLTDAMANGLLDPAVHKLSVDAIVNRWTEEDPRWELLPVAA